MEAVEEMTGESAAAASSSGRSDEIRFVCNEFKESTSNVMKLMEKQLTDDDLQVLRSKTAENKAHLSTIGAKHGMTAWHVETTSQKRKAEKHSENMMGSRLTLQAKKTKKPRQGYRFMDE